MATADDPSLYPDGTNPPVAKGVYLFKWEVGGMGSFEDYDTDKSTWLSFAQPPCSMTLQQCHGQIKNPISSHRRIPSRATLL